MDDLRSATERLKQLADDLHVAGLPTKPGVFTICGPEASQLARDLKRLLAAFAPAEAPSEVRAQLKPGDIRVMDGKRCRFIEAEIEGEKWEVLEAGDLDGLAEQLCLDHGWNYGLVIGGRAEGDRQVVTTSLWGFNPKGIAFARSLSEATHATLRAATAFRNLTPTAEGAA